MHNAWVDGESPLVDERKFTPWASPGWLSWNQYSPELAFCAAAGVLAMYKGGLTIETGAGQGYVTRRVGPKADALHVYESYEKMRNMIPDNGPWLVMDEQTPDEEELANCQLLICDSGMAYRKREISLWVEHAPVDSLLLMHDAGNGHAGRGKHYTHNHYRKLVEDLEIPGMLYKNPRGAFLGWKQQPENMDFLRSLLPT